MDIFKPLSEDLIREALEDTKRDTRARREDETQLAVDYLNNRQRDDIQSQLQIRYRQTQQGGAGQWIEPATIPLVDRYVSEQATAYNRPVSRELVNDQGDVDEDATQILTDELAAISYDERMHQIDRLSLLLGTCCGWYQAKRGSLRLVVTYPHHVYPVAAPDGYMMDPADPNDYLGHAVSINWTADDVSRSDGNTYVLMTPPEHLVYTSRDPYKADHIDAKHHNPFSWPQMVGDDQGRGTLKDLPLQMLTFWHKALPVNELITDTDVDLVWLNREINVQLSVLLDTARTQGWSQLILNLLNPETPPKQFVMGSRFALPLGPDESAQYLNAPNSYDELINLLSTVVKLSALSHRLAPNDFALEGSGPESGFAKLVSSLPKLEARTERVRRLKAQEETVAWPRIGAVLRHLGKLPAGAENLRMRVTFADIEFPSTADEESKRQEHEFKHGLSSPALVLAEREGITEEEATETIAERKAAAPAAPVPGQEQQQPPGRGGFGKLGQLIGNKEPIKEEAPKDDESDS